MGGRGSRLARPPGPLEAGEVGAVQLHVDPEVLSKSPNAFGFLAGLCHPQGALVSLQDDASEKGTITEVVRNSLTKPIWTSGSSMDCNTTRHKLNANTSWNASRQRADPFDGWDWQEHPGFSRRMARIRKPEARTQANKLRGNQA